MVDVLVERRRTGLDIVLGALLIIAGLIALGDTVFVTAVSVMLLGWITLCSGIIALASAVFRIGRTGFWPIMLSGGLLTVLGLMFLRNLGVAALTLTLIAGALFLVSGVARLAAAAEDRTHRWVLLFGGVVSTVLGLLVLFNIVAATFTLLGVLIGVQLLVDGLTIIQIGRTHVTAVAGRAKRPHAAAAAQR